MLGNQYDKLLHDYQLRKNQPKLFIFSVSNIQNICEHVSIVEVTNRMKVLK
jgi:hypothetical protein